MAGRVYGCVYVYCWYVCVCIVVCGPVQDICELGTQRCKVSRLCWCIVHWRNCKVCDLCEVRSVIQTVSAQST